jgi:gas vesicle protein
MADGKGKAGAMILGIAIGIVIAILYAPEKGEKMRKRLAKKSGEWSEKATEALESAGEVVEKGRKRFGV